jgi:UDP-N-acetyl-D-glucosamine dehydrogenase
LQTPYEELAFVNQDHKMVSVSPGGEVFNLPTEADYEAENQRLAGLVAEQRALGREIVLVIGVGFVGAVMAAVVADSTGPDGQAGKFVIGMQRPSTRSFWKIPYLNRGQAPVSAEDPEVDITIRRCVLERKKPHRQLFIRSPDPRRRGGG